MQALHVEAALGASPFGDELRALHAEAALPDSPFGDELRALAAEKPQFARDGMPLASVPLEEQFFARKPVRVCPEQGPMECGPCERARLDLQSVEQPDA